MHRGVNTISNQSLADQNRILKIVAAPWHKRYGYILAERQFPLLCSRSIGDNLPGIHSLTFFYDRSVIKTGILIGSDKFRQIVDGDIFFIRIIRRIMFKYNSAGIDVYHHGITLGNNCHAGISCHDLFNTGAYQGGLIHQQGNRLTLHVGSHQRPVCVIVFKKRYQRGRYTDKLIRGNIHQLNMFTLNHHEFPGDP